jgi:hypothetical protein
MTHPPSISGGHALINGVILADLGCCPFAAIETLQHGDEIILLCGNIQ